jgi:hypothetical protein
MINKKVQPVEEHSSNGNRRSVRRTVLWAGPSIASVLVTLERLHQRLDIDRSDSAGKDTSVNPKPVPEPKIDAPVAKESDEGRHICAMCFEKECTQALVPCGHVFCEQCGRGKVSCYQIFL